MCQPTGPDGQLYPMITISAQTQLRNSTAFALDQSIY